MAKICQMCGTSNDDAIEYCAACGSPMSGGDDAKKVGPVSGTGGRAGSIGARTVLGMPAVGSEGATDTVSPASDPAAAKKQKKETQHTVLGMAPVPAATVPQKPKEKPPMASVSEPPPPADNRTVMGMVSVPRESLPQKQSEKPPMVSPSGAPPPAAKPVPAGASKPAAKPAVDNKKTVLGMPAMGSEKPAVKMPAANYEDKRTVLGMPAMGSEKPSSEATQAESEPKKKPARTQKDSSKETPSSKPVSHEPQRDVSPAPAGDKTPPRAHEPQPATNEYDEWPDEQDEGSSRGPGLLIGATIVGVVVIIGLILFIYLFFIKGPPPLEPNVFPTADGNGVTVAFTFPEAPPGTTIQVVGQTVPVAGGQARVDIRVSDLKLGTNNLRAIYAEPGSAPVEQSFPIVLRHSVANDLSGLMAQDPFVLVNFRVAPEIGLAVAGKPVQLSGDAYSHRVPISQIKPSATPSGDNLIHQVMFQLTDARGQTEQGQHVVAIPLTTLRIDRPANKAVVATDSVTCAGVTEDGAQVTVNNQPVGVTAVGFNTSVPLVNLGEHRIEVMSRAPGKAPRTQSVAVTRIESLDSAIADWSKDLDKRLDYPTIGRDPNAHLGKKIKLSGRVVNINTEKGVTAFLLYIADGCPKGARCAVYVVFRGETDAGIQSWVDVYGVAKGTRSVDLPNGKKLEVPAVEAQFVLKSEPKKKKRRRRR